jgi:hypothetical protein
MGEDMFRNLVKVSVTAFLLSAFSVGASPVPEVVADSSVEQTAWYPTPWCPPYMPKQFCPT